MQVVWMKVTSYWLIVYTLLKEKGSRHKTRGSPGIALCDNKAIPTTSIRVSGHQIFDRIRFQQHDFCTCAVPINACAQEICKSVCWQ